VHFRGRKREDGSFELAVDSEGIDYLEDGLTELRRMQPGEAMATPAVSEGVSFLLKRILDGQGEVMERVKLLTVLLSDEDIAVLMEALWHACQRGDISDEDRTRAHKLRKELGACHAS
jgi:hypothetical protein